MLLYVNAINIIDIMLCKGHVTTSSDVMLVYGSQSNYDNVRESTGSLIKVNTTRALLHLKLQAHHSATL